MMRSEDECWYCGIVLVRSNRTRDHRIPRVRGGSRPDNDLNVVWCCLRCNQEKGPLTDSEYYQVMHDPDRLMALRKAVERIIGENRTASVCWIDVPLPSPKA